MNIWKIQIGEPLPLKPGSPRLRATMLVEELVRRGHSVIRWGSAFDHVTKTKLFDGDVELPVESGLVYKLLDGGGYKKNISLGRVWNHWRICRKFRKYISSMPVPDIVVAALPVDQLAFEAVRYAVSRDIPVLVDVRDVWMEGLLLRLPFAMRCFLKPVVRRHEKKLRYVFGNATAVTTMLQDFVPWIKRYGRDGLDVKVFHLGAESLQFQEEQLESLRHKWSKLLDGVAGKFVYVFAGTFGGYCEPSIVVRAFKKVKAECEETALILIGDGVYAERVRKEAEGVKDVFMPGWLEMSDVRFLLSRCDVAVCPISVHIPCFPNKVFSFFSAGLPLITSIPGELKDLLEKEEMGLCFSINSEEELAEQMLWSYNHRSEVEEMKMNVRRVFADRFDAKKIYSRFADFIEETARRGSK